MKKNIIKPPQSSVKMSDTILHVGFKEIIIYTEELTDSLNYRYSNAFVIDKKTFNQIIGWYAGTTLIEKQK